MDEQYQHLEELRQTYLKRLRVLEQQKALFGSLTPPYIVIEFDDLQKTIADVEAQFAPYADTYYLRGNARYSQGDLVGALADYTQAIELAPQDARSHYNRGIVRYQQGDLAGAMVDLTQTIRLDPRDARAYGNRGNTRSAQGDAAGAIADYTQAIELDPDYTLAFYNRGITHGDQGNREQAISDYQKVLTMSDDPALCQLAEDALSALKAN
jgi:tetratricopeptide (TPR) repeat protein